MVRSSAFLLSSMRAKPLANGESILKGDRWRISIITEALVRFEWSDDGHFVDEATQNVLVRDFERNPSFTVAERNGWLEIDTSKLHISYNQQPFSAEGLYAVIKNVDSTGNTWHYGDRQNGNLYGTCRTLDEADGATPLEPGVASRDGWAVIDDSNSNLIVETDTVNSVRNPFGTWMKPRSHKSTDLYLFGYGHNYREAVHDLYRLTGPTPLLPRFVFGNWWSRYHRYTETEYHELVERFSEKKLPFTVAVIDMDWHLVDDVDPKYGSGWTGYTWNREFFPDPKRFMSWLHEQGMKVTLNVHPRDGIRAFEESYPEMAKAMGIDPDTQEAVQFDLTDPKFMAAYFDLLHHPMEDDGVDFWWLDWQQGGVTRQPGLDPLWGLNHLHYLDSGRNDGSAYAERNPRPLTFSRYAGPGSHRYPIGFSGDTVVTWDSLKFQPYFTATASNIGYGWWSHDIGGHMFGYRDEELEARWYQLGTFSPINRLHSTDSPFNGKEPWNFQSDTAAAMTAALRLRHVLIPYLYTMNHRAAYEGEPLVQPMYWNDPEEENAYSMPTEFWFGTELVVSPVVERMNHEVQKAKADVWLPKGEWFDFFDGRRYASPADDGRRLEVWRGLDRIPVFAKAGAIVPMQLPADGERLNSVDNPSSLQVLVFPGASGSFTLWEDDGAPEDRIRWATTELALECENRAEGTEEGDGKAASFRITPVSGAADVVPDRRNWDLVFRGVAPESANGLTVSINGVLVKAKTSYDRGSLSLTVRLSDVESSAAVEVEFPEGIIVAANPTADDAFAVLKTAQVHYRTKELAYKMIQHSGSAALAGLGTLNISTDGIRKTLEISRMPDTLIRALAEVLLRS